MNVAKFIAEKLSVRAPNSLSRPLLKVALWSISLGVVVMIVSVCILRGFQETIAQKVVGFGSHIAIHSQDIGHFYQTIPISTSRHELEDLRKIEGVRAVQFSASKAGMAKTSEQIHGIVFRGINREFDSTFFAANLVDGRLFHFNDSNASNEIIVSKTIADKLKIGIGDKLRTYFWQGESYRARAFDIVGTYNTDLADFDEHFIIGDIAQVQKLNNWAADEVENYEVLINKMSDIDKLADIIYQTIGYDLTVSTTTQDHAAIFAWLDLLNSNIALIIAIMSVVCAVAIVTALLIMIFEKTAMIGTLKALGASNRTIRMVFLRKASAIALKGIAIGNAVAFAICFLQNQFQIIKLDSESYSMDHVPIDLNLWIFLLISIGSWAICMLAILLPTNYITRVNPSKSMRFE